MKSKGKGRDGDFPDPKMMRKERKKEETFLTRTNKITIFNRRHLRFCLCLRKHLLERFTYQWHLRIITISDALKQILHPKEPNDPSGMRNICIGEQPQFNFRLVDILEEFPQLGIRGNQSVEGKSVVDFFVIVERVDFVVEDEAG